MEFINKLYKFATYSRQTKLVERFKGMFYWRDYPQEVRYDSVADHSWRLALLILLFEDRLTEFDTLRALKMAIIHDLPEIIAGDDSPLGEDGTGKNTHAFNNKVKKLRLDKDTLAAQRLFQMLPKDKHQEFMKLWLEVESESTYEAKVVKALDRIEAMLQVLEYRKGHMFKEHLDFTVNYGSKGSNIDPLISEFAKTIASEMKKAFKEFQK